MTFPKSQPEIPLEKLAKDISKNRAAGGRNQSGMGQLATTS